MNLKIFGIIMLAIIFALYATGILNGKNWHKLRKGGSFGRHRWKIQWFELHEVWTRPHWIWSAFELTWQLKIQDHLNGRTSEGMLAASPWKILTNKKALTFNIKKMAAARVSTTKWKEDWKKSGVSIYFININEGGFPLYHWKIDKDNGDWTFLVTVVCQHRDRSKDSIQMTIESNLIRPLNK